MSNITIRDATIWDYKALCTIFAKANDLHREKLRPDYYRKVRPIISKKDFFLAAVAQQFEFGKKRVCVKIAEQDGKTVGAIFALSVKRRALGWSKFDKEAFIDNIYVNESHRRIGIGTSLLNAANEWAKHTRHEYISAKITNENEESKAFFSQAGFGKSDIIVGARVSTPLA